MSGNFSAKPIRGECSTPPFGPPRPLDAAPDASIVQLSPQLLWKLLSREYSSAVDGRGKVGQRPPQNQRLVPQTQAHDMISFRKTTPHIVYRKESTLHHNR